MVSDITLNYIRYYKQLSIDKNTFCLFGFGFLFYNNFLFYYKNKDFDNEITIQTSIEPLI